MKKNTNRKDSKGRKLYVGESQRKDGRYMYRYVDKRTQKRCTVYADDLPELREKEKKIAQDEYDGILTDVQIKNITLNELFERYLTTIDIKGQTRENYVNMWNLHVKDEIGNAKVVEIRSSDIKKLYTKMSKESYAYNTIKLIHNMLSPTMELALDDDIIRKNPARKALSDDYGVAPDEKFALSEEQQEKLLEFIKNSKAYNSRYHMMVIFLECLNRCGEFIGFTESEIDLKNREIRLEHQLIYKKFEGKYQLRLVPVKTESGERTIPITDRIYDAIIEHKKLNEIEGKKCLVEIGGHKDFLFLTRNGRPIMPSGINDVLYNIVNAYNKEEIKKAKCENREPVLMPKFSSHVLRHTGCTNKARDGMNVKALQYLMGHKHSSTTLEVYNHLAEKNEVKKEVERIEKKKMV